MASKLNSNKTNTINYTDNLPVPSKLLDSLRHTGYKLESAACDIIDNAIDAKANRIWVNVIKNKTADYIFNCCDNGWGMEKNELHEALRLGTEKYEYQEWMLGLFGLGLITASIATCRRVEVITRSMGSDDVWFGAHDLDIIAKKGDFVIEGPRSATAKEKELLDKYCEGESGTIVIWNKCDLVKDRNFDRVLGRLRKKIGQTYRVFLSLPDDRKITIYLNDKEVNSIDPLLYDDPETIVHSDEVYPIKVKNDNGVKEIDVRIRLVLLPYEGRELGIERGITYSKSGFYILRNLREIMEAQTLDLFKRHQLMSYVRGEIFFPSELDYNLGINFSKMSLNMTSSLKDQLLKYLGAQLRTLRRLSHNRMKASAKKKRENIDFSKIERYIQQRGHVLIKPKSEIERRLKRGEQVKKDAKKPKRKSGPRKNLTRKDIVKSLEAICKFVTISMGKTGPIYECNVKGKFLEIEVNEDHPFYDRFILENYERGEVDFFNCTGMLLYAMASADQLVEDQEAESVLHPWKTFMSSNLYGLLEN